jgi:hypothetical protein
MKQFRAYLQALPAERLPSELRDVDLASFHYGAWLRERGYDFKQNRETTPLFWDYLRFQRRAITRYFGELADYAREYAAQKGRDVLVSGNFFNLFDQYYPLEPKVDMIITEMRNTRYRQPAWYRYVAGFCGDKPVVVVENPYGGVVPELVAALKLGRGYDRFRQSLYEAAALGANMSVPYGAWMGSVIEDSFHPPHELCAEIQRFLSEHERLFSRRSAAETAVVFSVESDFQRVARRDQFADNRANVSGDEVIPFWQVCAALSDAAQPYDVVFFPDGDLRPDTIAAEQLRQYRTVILPDCQFLTSAQAAVLRSFLEQGGHVLALGAPGANLPADARRALVEHAGTTVRDLRREFALADLPAAPQVRIEPAVDLAIHLQRVADGVAVHFIRYDYDERADCVPALPELTIEVRLPERFTAIAVHSSAGELSAELSLAGDRHRITLRNVPLYGIAVLSNERV